MLSANHIREDRQLSQHHEAEHIFLDANARKTRQEMLLVTTTEHSKNKLVCSVDINRQ